MAETIYTNANIVLADEVVSGTLAFDEAGISGISSGLSGLPGATDCGGDYVIPGLVELHTDNLERHMMPRPKAYWPPHAAIINHDREISASGITTVFNALSVGHVHAGTRRLETLAPMLDAVESQSRAGSLKAEHRLHLRCEVSCGTLLELAEPLMGGPLVGLVSVMDHTPGQRQFASLEQYAVYYQGKYGMSDEELQRFITERMEDHRLHAGTNRRTIVAMARERGIPLASHDDATPDHVAEAMEDGVAIAEFPTTVEAAQASHDNGLAVLMGAPNVVRGGSHSGNVSAGTLAKAGHLDILSSDYVPASLLYGAMRLAETVDAISVPDAIATVSRTPARQIGLDDRGEIAEGRRADLVRFRQTEAGPVIRAVWREGERVA